MKKSFIVVSLLTISIFPALNSSWLSQYFQSPAPTETAEDKAESTYLSEVRPFGERELHAYQQLSYPEDREDFINKKLAHLYNLHSEKPYLFTQRNLDNIIRKITDAYQSVTPNAYMIFSPILKRFISYPYYEDPKVKESVVKELENIKIQLNSKLNDIEKKANEEIEVIKAKANKEIQELQRAFFLDIKGKLGDFKTPQHERTSARLSSQSVTIQRPKDFQSEDIKALANIPRL